jgi:outer membrane biosynthesis protein TonB
MIRVFALLSLLALLAPVPASAQEPVERTYPARVSVTAEGTVSGVELGEAVPEALAALARDAAGKLTFEPAAVQGVPVASKTTVLVRLRLAPAQGDALAASVVGVTAAKPVLGVPRYPIEAMRAGISALVWLQVEMGPDGRVDMARSRIENVDARHENGRKVSRNKDAKAFGEAALASAAQWAADPEEVDGVAVATSLRIPVTFCFPQDSKPCRVFAKEKVPATREPADAGIRLPSLKTTAAGDHP